MSMYITVFLRIMLLLSLAVMVFDYLRVEQLFIQMERGFIDGFEVFINRWPGFIFIIIRHFICHHKYHPIYSRPQKQKFCFECYS